MTMTLSPKDYNITVIEKEPKRRGEPIYYLATVEELNGMVSEGSTAEEAYAEILKSIKMDLNFY